MIAVYVLAKFCIYCGLCYALVSLFRLSVDSWNFSVAWGAARFGIGVLFGVPIADLYAVVANAGAPDWVSYAIAFGPLRIIEWALVFALIKRKHPLVWNAKAIMWILIGVVASMTSDGVALLSGVNELKFFC